MVRATAWERDMRSVFARTVTALLVAVSLASCGRDDAPQMMSALSANSGPDEFDILPNKPLQEPVSYSELPTPTPFGSNRADASPIADAVVLLGGNPAAVTRGETPSSDRQLVRYTRRYGHQDNIRSELASEDLEYRSNNRGRVLERLFDVNVYFRAYEHMFLDQYAEVERFRAMGVRAPAPPPEPEG